MRCRPQLIFSFLAAILLARLSSAQTPPAQDPATQDAIKFARIYGLIQQRYVDPVDSDRLILNGAIRGMLSALDPFSSFFDPDQFEALKEQSNGEALGFGSILYVQPGKVLVLQTAQGSPSWRAGLGPGDEIVEVNGQRVDRLDFQSLVHLLQEARSHPVRLGVIHPGKDVADDIKLSPAEVALPTVDNSFIFPDRNIGYIHISGFDTKTPAEVQKAIDQMGGRKLSGLILDLRNNHGGIVASAVQVASLFLKPGLTVLTMRGRSVPEKTYTTQRAASQFEMPMVVLVNGETASAAELLSAALEEHDRAVIAGEQTFGKGVVENVFPLSDNTGMALTVAQYFTPSGRCIQRSLPGTQLQTVDLDPARRGGYHTDDGRPVTSSGGITPDVTIPEPDHDPWLEFLDQRGAFTDFASQYLTFHHSISKEFEPNSQVLSAFRQFLGEQGVRVPAQYWKADQKYLALRIKTEIFNLVFGLAAGNRIETEGDPQVQKSLALFPVISQILAGPGSRLGKRTASSGPAR